MTEQWLSVPGFIGFYEASDQGNLRRVGKHKHLTPSINKDGYLQYCFSVDSVRKNITGHQAVSLAFHGPVPLGEQVRHVDGNRQNNVPSNLVYGTPFQNSQDMVEHQTQCRGEALHLSRLTEAQVLEIQSSQLKGTRLAVLYGVSKGTISMIRNRIIWKHI